MNARLTKLQRTMLILNLGLILIGIAVLLSDTFTHNSMSNLRVEPVVIVTTAIAISILITWAYFLWLRKSKGEIFWIERDEEKIRRAPRAIIIAALPIALAVGNALFVVPTLVLTPKRVLIISWSLIIACSSLQIFFIMTRGTSYLRQLNTK